MSFSRCPRFTLDLGRGPEGRSGQDGLLRSGRRRQDTVRLCFHHDTRYARRRRQVAGISGDDGYSVLHIGFRLLGGDVRQDTLQTHRVRNRRFVSCPRSPTAPGRPGGCRCDSRPARTARLRKAECQRKQLWSNQSKERCRHGPRNRTRLHRKRRRAHRRVHRGGSSAAASG